MPSTSDILNDISESTISHLPSGRYVDLPADELRSGEYNDVCGCSDVLFENWQKEPLINGIRGFSPPSSLGNSSSASGTINLTVLPQRVSVPPPPVVSGCPSSFLPTARPDAPGQVAEILPEGEPSQAGSVGAAAPSQQQRAAGSPDHDSQIWYNGEFISCAEYEKIRAKKDQQKTALYPANVPNTIYDVKTANTDRIFGSNFLPTNSDCGKIYRKVFCNTDRTHKPANLHVYCNDPLCPICYKKPCSKIANRVSERVMGFKSVYPAKKVCSLIFWGKKGTIYKNSKEAFDDAKRQLKDMGAEAGAIIYHPYRIRKEIQPKLRRIQKQLKLLEKPTKGFWEMAHDDALGLGALENYYVKGCHFHAQAAGYLENSKDYSDRTGCGYKKRGYLENQEAIQKNAYYLATHSVYESGKDSVQYYGLMSKYNLRRDQTDEYFDNVKCDICGSTLADYDYNADTKELSKLPFHSVLTRKIKVYKYWIRGHRPPSGKFLSASAHKKKLRQIIDEARAIQNQNLKGWDLS